MDNFTAFVAGLIVGGDGHRRSYNNGAKPKTNVALQDVLFCQCLANIIAELEEYESKYKHSPEEFINLLMPRHLFKEPYSCEEKRILEREKEDRLEYARWIRRLEESNKLVDDKGNPAKWEDLSVVKKIWQDPIYTVDKANLDLLFDYGSKEPIKKNGRLYDYRDNAGIQWDGIRGIAKRFFFASSPAAYLIYHLCAKFTQAELPKHGFEMDYTRFEMVGNSYASIKDTIKRERRKEQAKYLYAASPEICKVPWNETTRGLHSGKIRLTPLQKRLRDKGGKKSKEMDIGKEFKHLFACAIFLISVCLFGLVMGIAIMVENGPDAIGGVVPCIVFLGIMAWGGGLAWAVNPWGKSTKKDESIPGDEKECRACHSPLVYESGYYVCHSCGSQFHPDSFKTSDTQETEQEQNKS